MKTIIALVGLPGSGKTTYGNFLSLKLNIPFIDEPKSKNEIIYDNLIIASPFYCIKKNRKQLLNDLKEYKIIFVYFENNLEKALINCNKRPNKPININYWSKAYELEGKYFRKIII